LIGLKGLSGIDYLELLRNCILGGSYISKRSSTS
jgi:hypothetical protein